MSEQEQFLDVIDRDEAWRRFRAAVAIAPLPGESVPLVDALGRVLAEDVLAPVDVPAFDRSNVDGYAVRAADTLGATEWAAKTLTLSPERIDAGHAPSVAVAAGVAVSIATGGMLPRGADAVVMIEHADLQGDAVRIKRAVSPGAGISFAGSDMARGETVLRAGEVLTSRETGTLAAVGLSSVAVRRRPIVAIVSTGDEITAPGEPLRPAGVYDSNGQILADAVIELGGVPLRLGIVRDDLDELRQRLRVALDQADVVLLSGGTSKGQGDLCYRAVAELRDPGIVAHGVALKPGKPLCLASSRGKPIAILPGFPTSAVFTFHEFLAPVVRELAGRATIDPTIVQAKLAVRANSEIGRTEYLLVGLAHGDEGLVALPMGKGSGSVTTFSRADGFVTIDRHREIVEEGTIVDVRLLGKGLVAADLVVVGSHCVGLDALLSDLWGQGVSSKWMTVGSTAGLLAAKRGQCDVASIHLLDPTSGQYNAPFATDDLVLIPGYGRMQGIVFRPEDRRFAGETVDQILATTTDPSFGGAMVNRNQGSGTRIVIDRLLAGAKPSGYAFQPTSHTAVAAAIAQGRADWGLAIETVARAAGLAFVPVQSERYDFVVPKSRSTRAAVGRFVERLRSPRFRERLHAMGFDA